MEYLVKSIKNKSIISPVIDINVVNPTKNFACSNILDGDSLYIEFNPLDMVNKPIKAGRIFIGPMLILKVIIKIPQNILLYPLNILYFPPSL